MNHNTVALKTLFLASAVLWCLSGCAQHPSTHGPYQSEFERALSETSSEFQHQILADYEVTDSEYAAARERFRECMKDSGIPVELQEGGGYISREYRTETDLQNDTKCNDDSLTYVENLYYSARNNPDNRSYFARVRECLQHAGLVDETLTETELEIIFNEASHLSDAERASYTLPGGTPVDDPTVVGCFTIR